LGEFGGAEQRAQRRAGRHGGKGTARKRAEPILQGKRSASSENPPSEKIAPGDLALRERLYDLGAIITGFLRFSLPDAGLFACQIHGRTLQLTNSLSVYAVVWPSVLTTALPSGSRTRIFTCMSLK